MDPEIVLGLNDPFAEAALIIFRQSVRSLKMNTRVVSTSKNGVAHDTATTAVVKRQQ
jgi:hypothetical protein